MWNQTNPWWGGWAGKATCFLSVKEPWEQHIPRSTRRSSGLHSPSKKMSRVKGMWEIRQSLWLWGFRKEHWWIQLRPVSSLICFKFSKHLFSFSHARSYTHSHKYAYVFTCIYTFTHHCAHTYEHSHTHRHTDRHTYSTHFHIRADTDSHIHILTCTHTFSLTHSCTHSCQTLFPIKRKKNHSYS